MRPLDHVDDYPEIPISLASTRTALKTGEWRSVRPVLVERTAPCRTGCPAGVAVADYLHHLGAGRLEEASAAFARRNPFPRITGRVCPHPCEDSCNLGVVTRDGPVAIRSIERWLGDATAHLPHTVPDTPTGRWVGVVGSGPAGLAAAYYLRRTGHEVTVFERRPEAGGMLRHAIPEYRLPAAIIDQEVSRLSAMGIGFRTGVDVGGDVGVDDLADQFDALFVATGAGRERPMGILGEELLASGLAFLESANRGRAPMPGERCAVIGGGNTALDVARVLCRLGVAVTVLYRRTADEMPAIREEYEQALADGVEFSWLTQPRAVATDNGGIRLTVEEMELGEADSTGRRRPLPTGRVRVLSFDEVFAAVGEVADLTPLPQSLLSVDGWLEAGPGGVTADSRVHAGGDLVTGPATVIEAIVAGREAARSIDARLGFSDRWPTDEVGEVVAAAEVNAAHRPRQPRVVDPAAAVFGPLDEETLTIGTSLAGAEIERCLSCGHCNECGTCFVFCPDGAITWEDGPLVDLEFCKGCGICVTECPGRAMLLVDEREALHA